MIVVSSNYIEFRRSAFAFEAKYKNHSKTGNIDDMHGDGWGMTSIEGGAKEPPKQTKHITSSKNPRFNLSHIPPDTVYVLMLGYFKVQTTKVRTPIN